jgi:hypothetical protein
MSMSEKGSDEQMTDEQREELARRTDEQRAEVVEEERKTAAQPVQDDPVADEERVDGPE